MVHMNKWSIPQVRASLMSPIVSLFFPFPPSPPLGCHTHHWEKQGRSAWTGPPTGQSSHKQVLVTKGHAQKSFH